MKEKVIQDGSGRKLLRRNPKQDRSRDRIDDIIAVAQQLIGEKGIDAVTMKEIGTLTGGPISSVYQYFRDKDGILAMIYEQHLELTRKIVADILGTISTPSDALIAPARMFDIYYSRMRELPHALEFLAAIKASKTLAKQDIEEARLQALNYYEATARFVDQTRRDEYRSALFLLFVMADATLRLMLRARSAESAALGGQFKSLMQTQISYYFDSRWPEKPIAVEPMD